MHRSYSKSVTFIDYVLCGALNIDEMPTYQLMYTEVEASSTVDQTGLLGRQVVYRYLRPTPLVNVYTTSSSCYILLI